MVHRACQWPADRSIQVHAEDAEKMHAKRRRKRNFLCGSLHKSLRTLREPALNSCKYHDITKGVLHFGIKYPSS